MLSIIIPTLNEEEDLPPLLDSIKKQDFKDYEVVVADAGSKDRTVEIAKGYGCIVVKGGLLPVGRNKGAEAAKGNILLFLDSDVLLPRSKFLSNVVNEFYKRKLGSAGIKLVPRDCKPIDKAAHFCWNTIAFLMQSFLPHASQAIMAKKEVHDAIGGFDKKIVFVEDHPYVRNTAKVAKFGFINDEYILVSVRRYEKDGRFQVYLKYILAGIYILFKPIRSNIFNYKFGHYENSETKK